MLEAEHAAAKTVPTEADRAATLHTGDFGLVSLTLRLPIERADWYHALQVCLSPVLLLFLLLTVCPQLTSPQNAIAEYIPSENCRPTIRARFCSLGCTKGEGGKPNSIVDGTCSSLAKEKSVGVLGGIGILSDAAFALEMKTRAVEGKIASITAGECVSMRIMSTPPPRNVKQGVKNGLTAVGYAWHVRELVRDRLGTSVSLSLSLSL